MDRNLQTPRSPESTPIQKDIAEYILDNPGLIFEEYQKLLTALEKTGKYTARDVSIIYRREVADTKSSQFLFNQTCTTWLVNNYEGIITSPAELTSIVENLSGLKSADLSDKSSEKAEEEEKEIAAEAVEQLRDNTNDRVRNQLPAAKPENDINDISDWIARNSN